MTNEPEEWRAAPGYEGRYEVSNLGRIRSLPRVEMSAKGPRKIRGGMLNPAKTAEGYLHVSLRTGGKLSMVRLHRLVAMAFVPGQNALHKQVAHLDGVRANARADNLKWVSKGENESHKFIHGTNPAGERHGAAKLTEVAVRAIRYGPRRPAAAIAQLHGISRNTVYDIWRGRRWTHV